MQQRSDDNLVVLSGRLTDDAKLNETDGGTNFLTFSLASNEYYSDKTGNESKKTCFVDCVLWGVAAKNYADRISKGSPVRITGKIETRKLDKKTFTQLNVSGIYLLNPGSAE